MDESNVTRIRGRSSAPLEDMDAIIARRGIGFDQLVTPEFIKGARLAVEMLREVEGIEACQCDLDRQYRDVPQVNFNLRYLARVRQLTDAQAIRGFGAVLSDFIQNNYQGGMGYTAPHRALGCRHRHGNGPRPRSPFSVTAGNHRSARKGQEIRPRTSHYDHPYRNHSNGVYFVSAGRQGSRPNPYINRSLVTTPERRSRNAPLPGSVSFNRKTT